MNGYVPGRIDSPRSKGCHDLIKKGAKLCECAEDIFTEFEYLFPGTNRPTTTAESGNQEVSTLSENEQAVYEAIDGDPVPMDSLIRASGLSSSAVSVALLNLEMKQFVKQLPGKVFLRNSR